jgi:CRISPR-associated protein Csb2
LIATWHRKADHARYPEAVLQRLVESLAAAAPVYRLPPAIRAHSRHYMPQGKFKAGRIDTTLVFDAFVRVHPDRDLVAAWPEVTLGETERDLLSALLRNLGFLGRAESWVEARLLDDWDSDANCRPSELAFDPDTGEAFEPIRLAAPLDPTAYAVQRSETIATHGLKGSRLKRPQKRILETLPERLLDALAVDTGALQQAGWSCPPAARFVTYQRPADCFTPDKRSRSRHAGRPFGTRATTVRLALSGKPLPPIERALRIGEIARKAAIHHAERVAETVPASLSGHGLPASNRHGHAFYLPEDADGDGHIDHILIHAPDGLSGEAIAALDRIDALWERGGGRWRVLFEGAAAPDALGSIYTGIRSVWQSATPYLCPWHRKRGFGIGEQIARECDLRGWPEPTVDFLENRRIEVRPGVERRPVQFQRFRERRGLNQPDKFGHALRLVFPQPISGPVALGFGCHYGLGMFRPVAP